MLKLLATLRLRPILLACLLLSFTTASVAEEDWRELDWLELMPEEDLRLLNNLPEIEHEGSGAATLPDEILTGRVVPEMDGTRARIPGFVVPLKTVGNQRIVEFFLVPYFGACIHVPPPPPNQIIHVTYEPGFTLDALYEPIWVQGTLKTESVENDIGAASYTLVSEKIEPYEGG